MAGGEETANTLEATPTWAVATVVFVLIVISIIIEYLLHLLHKYFHRLKRKSLIQALDKIKSELMLLGFISLLLTVGQKPIANICIPKSVGESFLPCKSSTFGHAVEETKCSDQGKVSLMSREGAYELQYLIFVLAMFHVSSCVLTFALGMAKMKRWESWEAETRTLEYQFSYDPRRFQLTYQTSFGKRHLKCWSDNRLLRWPASFVRQFFNSVSKSDYFTLRHGFIMAHFAEGSHFNFQKYIRRNLEKDFGVVMGISWWIWLFSVFVIFFNAHGFYNYLWVPFIPLVMLLLVGTKLQGIITKMCLDSHDKSHVVRGTLLVKPSNHFFWFNWPQLLLHLLHFILFQNSFQLAFFTWTWYKFGLRSCFHHETEDIVIRLGMGVIVQILCGYVTLPLYALVTQMGTSMRKAVFTANVVKGLKKWRAKARKNLALRNHPHSAQLSLDASLETSLSLGTSPSFSGHDASFSTVDFDRPSDDAEYVALEIREAQKAQGETST
ncbi:PREDICTED: MLO-like protein 12 [Prunus mume]|uniref:MLO-like protein n=1 Tax=Prunus mume TaxID=102107 RepID=A0ABM0NI68_PRUMU|nr:PREDICTED: MLO-like protein 12 [Prunus mume]